MTRSASSVQHQGYENSPMLMRYPDTSPLEMDEGREPQFDSPTTNNVNGIRNSFGRGKKSVSLLTEHNSNSHDRSCELTEGFTIKPLIKMNPVNGSERLFADNDMAEDYV